MFRKKEEGPRADIDRYVPKLQEYLRIHYVKPEPQRRYSLREDRDVRYSLPSEPDQTSALRKPVGTASPEGVRFSKAVPSKQAEHSAGGSENRYSLPVSDNEDIRAMLNRAPRDMSVLESPAVRNYYHSWEKQNSVRKSFSSEVMRMVKEKYPKASRFYGSAGLDRRIFNKIKTDYGYQPSRNTAMRCCIGLHLNGKEAEELLQLAGYAFSPSDPSDLVLRFCLDNGIWDIPSINYLLDSFDIKDLEGVAPGRML